jgi:hypothetical protein
MRPEHLYAGESGGQILSSKASQVDCLSRTLVHCLTVSFFFSPCRQRARKQIGDEGETTVTESKAVG